MVFPFPFCSQACVDVRASSVFWQQMELAETIQGQPKLPEWLSTHPSHENRAEHLDRLIPEVSSLREGPFPLSKVARSNLILINWLAGIDSQFTLIVPRSSFSLSLQKFSVAKISTLKVLLNEGKVRKHR